MISWYRFVWPLFLENLSIPFHLSICRREAPVGIETSIPHYPPRPFRWHVNLRPCDGPLAGCVFHLALWSNFWWCRWPCGVMRNLLSVVRQPMTTPKGSESPTTHLKCDETPHRGDELAERLSISSTRNPLPKSRHSILSSSQPLWDTWTNVVLRFPNVGWNVLKYECWPHVVFRCCHMYGYPLEDDSPVLLLHFLVAVLNHPTISKHVLELMTLPAQAIEPLESRESDLLF